MFAVDSAGVAIQINDEGTRLEGPTSGRRVRANRRNARNSPGATTPSGRKRSAQNALKHGVLASALEPIERGPFAEEPEAFWERVRLVVASLQPRDPMEERVALQLAALGIRSDRLDQLETARYEGEARLPDALRDHLDTADGLDQLAARARGLCYFLADVVDVAEPPYRDYAWLMRNRGPRPGLRLKGFWDDAHEPSSDSDWERAFLLLLKKLWPTRAVAAGWAYELQRELEREWLAVEGREREIVAGRVLDGPFDQVTRYQARITKDYIRLFALYQALRSRELPSAGSNEPNDQTG